LLGGEYDLFALHQHDQIVCGKAWHHEDPGDPGDMSKAWVRLESVEYELHLHVKMGDSPDLADPDHAPADRRQHLQDGRRKSHVRRLDDVCIRADQHLLAVQSSSPQFDVSVFGEFAAIASLACLRPTSPAVRTPAIRALLLCQRHAIRLARHAPLSHAFVLFPSSC